MNTAQNMREYIERELTNEAPKDSGLKVGDEVTWTNDYGVKFTNKIIGFNYTNEFNKEYNRFVHLDTSAYWFPHGVGEFKEDTSDHIYEGLLGNYDLLDNSGEVHHCIKSGMAHNILLEQVTI